jgi:hypothetical protein
MLRERSASHLRWLVLLMALGLMLALAIPAEADHTTEPASVTVAGSLQRELGCPSDWQPDCANTNLVQDDVWQSTFSVPAGSYEYKAALNDTLTENYGAGAVPDGPNILLTLAAPTDVKFFYDHKSHWVTDNVNSTIATVAGDFQSELGCPDDWQPDCLLSWLQDPDGDGVYEFATSQIPAGGHEFMVALDEAWDTSYPSSNVPFTVAADGDLVTVTYDSATNDVTVTSTPSSPPSAARFWVDPTTESLWGTDFEPNSSVSVVVNTVEVPGSPFGTDVAGSFEATFGSAELDLRPLDQVDVTDGSTNKDHTITDLYVNAATDEVAGTAEPDSDVEVRVHGTDALRHEIAGPDGDWSVDFAQPGHGPDEQSLADLQPGSSGYAQQCDSDNDCTNIAWEIPDVANRPPAADVNGPYTADEGSTVVFDASGSSDPDDDLLLYTWTLSPANGGFDGTTGETPSHFFEDQYAGAVTVTVDDGHGASDTASNSVTISNVAPTVGLITIDPTVVEVGDSMAASAQFTDPGVLDTHTAVWDWGDTNSSSGTVTQGAGFGSVANSHTYGAAGVYTVTLTVTDDDGGVDVETFEFAVVYDPSEGFVTGGGWIDSPAGAFKDDESLTGKATFGFVSKYKKGAKVPTGNTEFQFKAGDLNFHSSTYDWLVVTGSGNYARYKGVGTIDGAGEYGFMIWAGDKDPDTFRIKIWEEDGGGVETVIYDNGSAQAIGGGSIIVHTKKK